MLHACTMHKSRCETLTTRCEVDNIGRKEACWALACVRHRCPCKFCMLHQICLEEIDLRKRENDSIAEAGIAKIPEAAGVVID